MAIALNSSWGFSSAAKLNHISRSSGGSNYRFVWEKPSILNVRFAEPRSSLKDVRWVPLATGSNKAAEESGIADPTDAETTNAQPDTNIRERTSPLSQEPIPKKALLTARERLRAARVLSRYTESKPSKPKLGSRVLDALRESDRGKRRSGLPDAPTNMLDDSKRGMPKEGLTFNFPGGSDLLLIVFSFVFISTVMFTTTYIVWKLGAIHFNEN